MAIEISKINPYIRVFMRSVLPAGTEIERRVIFDYELIFVEKGGFTLEYDGVDYPCFAGQFLLLRPDISHRFHGIGEDLSQPHIHFDITHAPDSGEVPVCFKDRDRLSERERGMLRPDVFGEYEKTPYVTFADERQARALFYECLDPTLTPLMRKGKLTELLGRLIADNFPHALTAAETALSVERQVKNYIDAGQGAALSLAALSRQFGYSKYYLERCFRERYGCGIIAYRNERRLQKARRLLETESVSAVAEALGYSSIYVFSRAYKNRFGTAPTAYKKK